jgi:methyl-accepting chemotaxis protein
MAFSLSISSRTLALLVTVGVTASAVTAWTSWQIARNSLLERAFDALVTVREVKSEQIQDYFATIADQALSLSESEMVVNALRGFSRACATLTTELPAQQETELRLFYEREVLPRLQSKATGPTTLDGLVPDDRLARLLQHRFLAASPFGMGAKHQLDDPSDGTEYGSVHRRYHPLFRRFIERFGYYDLFLVEATSGRIVYSVYKEIDFATSLDRGPYRETNLAEAVRAARDSDARDFLRLVDYESYLPSYGARASFIASPIFDGDELIGVLAFQMPLDRIDGIMTNKREWSDVGLGESGECYLVGEDYTLRSESRFLIEDREGYLSGIRAAGLPANTIDAISTLGSAVGLQEVRTQGVARARAGEVGSGIFTDYRGIRVLSAFKPLSISNVRWTLLSEIDEAEALAPVDRLRNSILVWVALIFAAVLGIAFAFARSLVRPIEKLSRVATEVAGGNLDAQVAIDRSDEIGALARSFDEMRRSLQKLVQQQAHAIDALSMPLIPLRDDVLVMPLVGDLDERRLDKVRDALIEGLHERGARAVIIDLTGLPSLGESVAKGLVRAAQAARLVGAEVVVTGMQADTAKTLSALDLRLEGLHTERSLQAGIAAILESKES